MALHNFEETIEACKQNDLRAQEKLYKHYFGLMYHICAPYTTDRQGAISLINEGFLKIFTKLPSFNPDKGSFENWIKKIMTNTCIDFSRSNKSDRIVPIEETTESDENLQLRQHNFIEDEVLFLIRKLSPVTRQVFSLHVFKGYSHKEIAHLMNMAESTSRWHVLEARKNLKPQLQKG